MHATASERGADGTTGFQSGEEHDLRSLKRMLLGAVATMAIVAGVAVSPASASAPPAPTGTVPTRGTTRRTRTFRISPGEASTCASGSVTTARVPPSGDGAPGRSRTGAAIRSTARFRCRSRSSCSVTIDRRLRVRRRGSRRRPASRSSSSSCSDAEPARTSSRSSSSSAGWSCCKPTVDRRRRRQRAAISATHDGSTRSRPSFIGLLRAVLELRPDPHDPRAPRQGHASRATSRCEAELQRVGPRRSPHAAGRLGQVGRRRWRARPTDHNAADAMTNWDIHDDSLPTEGHTITTRSAASARRSERQETYTNFDAVDNCTDAAARRAASRRCSARCRAPATPIGPFDPIYPYDTMLSDGKVDAGDAPMPAAQIDVTIKRQQRRRPDRHQRRRLPLPELQDRGLQP